jgi:hypothetical protein
MNAMTPRLVHAMLDGVFERCNNLFNIRRQLATTFDVRPQRYRRRLNQATVQCNGIEIIVKIWPPTAVKRIARLPDTGSTVSPVTGPSDVRAPFVGEKHISASIEALCLTLQAPCARGERRQVGVVGHDHEHVDIFGIRLGGGDRAQNSNSPNTGKLADRSHESAQRVE